MSIIGNTPIIKIKYRYNGEPNYLYVKLEYYNLTGSIKDRIVQYIVNDAIQKGELKKGQTIVEATSGNTGISLAAIGAKIKSPVYIFMPDWVSNERKELIKSYGAKVQTYTIKEGGFSRCIREAKRFTTKEKAFLLNQFSNSNNILAHYNTTAEEILKQICEPIGGFVSGVGTGGTIMGIGKKLKKVNNKTIICAVEPDKMPVLSQNRVIASHKIEGIGNNFVPELIDKNFIDKVIVVNDDDAINMSKKIAKELGIGVGISSGANFLGAVVLSKRVDNPVVTIFVDDNKKYMSAELTSSVEENEGYISNKIELIEWEEI